MLKLVSLLDPIYWAMIIAIPAFALHVYAEHRCTLLDVQTGKRDSMALIDDYGSNRGWYWRWKIPSIIGALVAAPGILFGFLMLIVIAFSGE